MRARYWAAACLALAALLPLAAVAEEAFTVRDTDVFAGPSSEYPPVAQLPTNAALEVFGCLSDWSWCDVGFGPDRGWIYAGDIVVPYDNRRVAVIEFGPRIHLPVLTFSLVGYWGEHYRGRPWYGERQQWAGRVHLSANRGGRPPAGHERAASVAPAGQQAMPTRQAPAQSARQSNRNAQPAEVNRQAETSRASKQAQQQPTRQQAQQQSTRQQAQQQSARQQAQQQSARQQTQQQAHRAAVAQAPTPQREPSQQQSKAQPVQHQAPTRTAQAERQAQQPQRAQQAAKTESAPKGEAKDEKPKDQQR